MKTKIKQTLIGLAIATIAGCGSEDLKYNRDNIEVEVKLRSGEVESVAFNSGCYRVVADRQAVGYNIKVKRRVDLVTGVPLEGCEDTIPEISQLVRRVNNYSVPNLQCYIYDKNGNKYNLPMSSAEQIEKCSGQNLRKTADCLTEMVSAEEKVKCEYR
ncbi:hypothetical protein HYX11_02455 [Candidatus Woesearchaeota archaeon]|nr:hypothetical protein [Candidatus Woesearchaeota archaeon]